MCLTTHLYLSEVKRPVRTSTGRGWGGRDRASTESETTQVPIESLHTDLTRQLQTSTSGTYGPGPVLSLLSTTDVDLRVSRSYLHTHPLPLHTHTHTRTHVGTDRCTLHPTLTRSHNGYTFVFPHTHTHIRTHPPTYVRRRRRDRRVPSCGCDDVRVHVSVHG